MTNSCDVGAIAMSLVIFPFPYVFLPFFVFPKTVSLHHSIIKIPHIILISKFEIAFPMGFVVEKISKVDGAIRKFHITLSNFKVKAELTLIDCFPCKLHS